jgi:hypothetical protein
MLEQQFSICNRRRTGQRAQLDPIWHHTMDGSAELRVAHNGENLGSDAGDHRSHQGKACCKIGNFRLPRGVADEGRPPR